MSRRSIFEDLMLTNALDLQSQQGEWTASSLLSLTSCRLDIISRDAPGDKICQPPFTDTIVDRAQSKWLTNGWSQRVSSVGNAALGGYEFTDLGLAVAIKAAGAELGRGAAAPRYFIFNMFPRIPQELIDRALSVPDQWAPFHEPGTTAA